MIEINLVPGAAKRRRRGGGGVGLPGKLKGVKLPEFDRLMAFTVVMWLVVPALTLWMFLQQRGDRDELQAQYEAMQLDSANLASVYAQVAELDTIRRLVAERVAVIEEIDQARYNWPHIMEEVYRAIPDFLWLDNLRDVPLGADPMQPSFSIAGKAANPYAVSDFMVNLEASPFIKDVRYTTLEQTEDNGKQVYAFVVDGTWENPPPDVIAVESVLGADGGN